MERPLTSPRGEVCCIQPAQISRVCLPEWGVCAVVLSFCLCVGAPTAGYPMRILAGVIIWGAKNPVLALAFTLYHQGAGPKARQCVCMVSSFWGAMCLALYRGVG